MDQHHGFRDISIQQVIFNLIRKCILKIKYIIIPSDFENTPGKASPKISSNNIMASVLADSYTLRR